LFSANPFGEPKTRCIVESNVLGVRIEFQLPQELISMTEQGTDHFVLAERRIGLCGRGNRISRIRHLPGPRAPCGPQKQDPSLRNLLHDPIFMMQAAEYGSLD
jgi:hypothetical protein